MLHTILLGAGKLSCTHPPAFKKKGGLNDQTPSVLVQHARGALPDPLFWPLPRRDVCAHSLWVSVRRGLRAVAGQRPVISISPSLVSALSTGRLMHPAFGHIGWITTAGTMNCLQ